MPSPIEVFIRFVEVDTQQHDVELRFVPSSIVTLPDDSGYECAGFFTEHPDMILCVATGKPRNEWLPILVHEYSHFRQWVEKSKKWSDNLYEGADGEGWLDDWIHERIELSPDDLDRYLDSTLAVELDAEKRSLEYIEGFSLPIEKQEYAQRANASLMYYGYIPISRQWFDYNPFEIKEIYSEMPTELLPQDDYLNLSQFYVDLYEQNCFKKNGE